jgi:integrase
MLELMRRKSRDGSLLPNWYCQINIDGKRVVRSLGTSNKKSAEKKAKDIFEKLEQQIDASLVPTLSAACDRMYREVWVHNNDSMNPVRKIKALIAIVGDLKLSSIKPETISIIESTLQENKLSQATINRYKTTLLAVLNRARDSWNILSSFPKITKAKETGMRERLLTPQEEVELITYLSNLTTKDIKFDGMLARYHHTSEMIAVLVDTGMRLGELLTLTPAMIDLEYGIVHLTGLLCKSAKGRSIPMSKRVKGILSTKVGAGRIYPYDKNQIIRIFHWAKANININDSSLVLHSLRHTFASRILRKGATLKQVKDLLGHADFKTTERYARYEISNLQQAVSLLD